MIIFNSVFFSVAHSLLAFVGLSSQRLLLFNHIIFGLPFFLHSTVQWLKFKIRGGGTVHSG